MADKVQAPDGSDKLQSLYDAVSQDYDIGSYDDFKSKMADPEKQRAFYDGVGKEYELGTFDEFSQKITKTDPQPPAEQNAYTVSGTDKSGMLSTETQGTESELPPPPKQTGDSERDFQNNVDRRDQLIKHQNDSIVAGNGQLDQIGKDVKQQTEQKTEIYKQAYQQAYSAVESDQEVAKAKEQAQKTVDDAIQNYIATNPDIASLKAKLTKDVNDTKLNINQANDQLNQAIQQGIQSDAAIKKVEDQANDQLQKIRQEKVQSNPAVKQAYDDLVKTAKEGSDHFNQVRSDMLKQQQPVNDELHGLADKINKVVVDVQQRQKTQKNLNDLIYKAFSEDKFFKIDRNSTTKEQGEQNYNTAQIKVDAFMNKLRQRGFTDDQIETAINAHKEEWRMFGIADVRSPRQKQAQDQYTRSYIDNGIGRVNSAAGTFDQEVINFVSDIPKAVGILGSKGASLISGKDIDPEYNGLYKLGSAISNWGQEMFPNNPKYKEDYINAVARTAGGLLPYMIGGEALKGISGAIMPEKALNAIEKSIIEQAAEKKAAEPLTVGKLFADHAKEGLPMAFAAGVSGATGGYAQAYQTTTDANTLNKNDFIHKYAGDGAEESIKTASAQYDDLHGRNPNDVAWNNFKIGLASGSAFLLSPALTLSRLNKVTGGYVQNIIGQGLAGGVDGMVQMPIMKAFENLSAQQSYEKTRHILDGVVDAGASGFMVNGIISGLTAALTGGRATTAPKSESRAYYDQAIADVKAKQQEVGKKNYFEKPNSPVVEQLQKQMVDLQDQLAQAPTQISKQSIMLEMNDLTKRIEAEQDKAAAHNADVGVQEIQRAFNEKKIAELQEQISKPGVTEAQKERIQTQIDALGQTKAGPDIAIESVSTEPIRVADESGQTGIVRKNSEGDVEFTPDGMGKIQVFDKGNENVRTLFDVGLTPLVDDTMVETKDNALVGKLELDGQVRFNGQDYKIIYNKNAPEGFKKDKQGNVTVIYAADKAGNKIIIGADSPQGKEVLASINKKAERHDEGIAKKLSLSDAEQKEYARISDVGVNEKALSESQQSIVSLIRGSGDKNLRAVDEFLRSISNRYGGSTDESTFNRADRYQWRLLQRKLQVGDKIGAELQQKEHGKDSVSGENDSSKASGKEVGNSSDNVSDKNKDNDSSGGSDKRSSGQQNNIHGENTISAAVGSGDGASEKGASTKVIGGVEPGSGNDNSGSENETKRMDGDAEKQKKSTLNKSPEERIKQLKVLMEFGQATPEEKKEFDELTGPPKNEHSLEEEDAPEKEEAPKPPQRQGKHIEGIEGEKTKTKFTADKAVPVTFKLVEADDIQPSHLPSGERNPKHQISQAQPKERNDAGSRQAQDKIAESPNFKEVSESPNAYFGSPIINQYGEVIQGNNRSIGLKQHYAKGGEQYKADLASNAEQFGFTKEQVEGMRQPVLVREADVTDQEAITLGQHDVKDLETGGKQRIDAVATSRKISREDKSKLASLLFSEDKPLKEAIRDNASAVGEILKKYLNPAQLSTAFNKEGGFTAKGMDDISEIVTHFLFEKGDATLPAIFNELPDMIKKGLQKALPHILSVEDSKSLIRELQYSLMALHGFKNSGQENFDGWARTVDVFKGGAPIETFTPLEMKLARLLSEAKTQVEIKKAFAAYEAEIQGKKADMFEPEVAGSSKVEAVKKIFNLQINESIPEKYLESEGRRRDQEAGGKPEEQPQSPAELDAAVESIERKAESDSEAELEEAIREADELLGEAHLKTAGGVSPNKFGVFDTDEAENIVLPNQQKGRKGIDSARISVVQLENGKWVSSHSVMDKGDNGGSSSPLTQHMQFNTREQAISDAATIIYNRSEEKRTKDWAKKLIENGKLGVGESAPRPPKMDTEEKTPIPVMQHLAKHVPELKDLMDQGIDVQKKLDKLTEKVGHAFLKGKDIYPFPYRLLSLYTTSNKATEAKKTQAISDFKQGLDRARQLLDHPPTEEEIRVMKNIKAAEEETRKAKAAEILATAEKNFGAIRKIKEEESDFIAAVIKGTDLNSDSIAGMLLDGISKDQIVLAKKIGEAIADIDGFVFNSRYVEAANKLLAENLYSIDNIIETLSKKHVGAIDASARRDELVDFLKDLKEEENAPVEQKPKSIAEHLSDYERGATSFDDLWRQLSQNHSQNKAIDEAVEAYEKLLGKTGKEAELAEQDFLSVVKQEAKRTDLLTQEERDNLSPWDIGKIVRGEDNRLRDLDLKKGDQVINSYNGRTYEVVPLSEKDAKAAIKKLGGHYDKATQYYALVDRKTGRAQIESERPIYQKVAVDSEKRVSAAQRGEVSKGDGGNPIEEKPKIQFERNDEKIKKLKNDLDDMLKDFGGDLNVGVNPEKAAKAIKIVANLIQQGYYKIEDIGKLLIEKGANELLPYIKDAYAHIKDNFDLPLSVKTSLSDERAIDKFAGGLDRQVAGGVDPGKHLPGGRAAAGSATRATRPPIRIADEGQIPLPSKDHVKQGQYDIDEHQRLAVNLALERYDKNGKAFLLADGAGVGKTRQLLVTGAEMNKKTGKPTLFISKKNVIDSIDFERDLKALGLKRSQFELGTYDDMSNGKVGKGDYGLAIYDESQNLKNPLSIRAQAQKGIKSDHNLFASATPMDKIEHAIYFMSEITDKTPEEVEKQLGVEIKYLKGRDGEMYPVAHTSMGADTYIERLLDLRNSAIENGAMIRREYPFFGEINNERLEMPAALKKEIGEIEKIHTQRIDEAVNIALARLVRDILTPKKAGGEFGEFKADLGNKMAEKSLFEELKKDYNSGTGAYSQRARKAVEDFKRDERFKMLQNIDKANEQHKVQPLFEAAIKALKEGKQVVIVGNYVNEHTIKAGTPKSKYGYYEKKIPGSDTFLQQMAKKLSEAGIETSKIFGGNKDGVYSKEQEKFQSGETPVLLMTAKSGGTGVNLDDIVGDKPRVMLVATGEYSGDTLEQLLGRVSRRNTQTPADVRLHYFDNQADNNRFKKSNEKRAVIKSIVSGEGDLDAGRLVASKNELLAQQERQKDYEKMQAERKEQLAAPPSIEAKGEKGIVVKNPGAYYDDLIKAGGKYIGNKQVLFPKTKQPMVESIIAKQLGANEPAPEYGKSGIFAQTPDYKVAKNKELGYELGGGSGGGWYVNVREIPKSADWKEDGKIADVQNFNTIGAARDFIKALEDKGIKSKNDIQYRKLGVTPTTYTHAQQASEPQKTYTTKAGEAIPFTSLQLQLFNGSGESDVQRKSGQANDYRSELKPGEVCWMERKLSELPHINLTGEAKIHSSADVAYLFRHLESAASENAFAVLHTKDGGYHVLYLGTGTTGGVAVDLKLLYAAAREFGSHAITFVHNHPSGNLTPSDADMIIHRNMKQAFEDGKVKVNNSVIINLDSGKYSEFTSMGETLPGKHSTYVSSPRPTDVANPVQAKVHAFDRQVLYTPSSERTVIKSAHDVAEFLSQQKRGVVDKTGIMILDRKNSVTKYMMEGGNLSLKDLTDKIIANIGKHGDTVILHFNKAPDVGKMQALKDTLRKLNLDLLDVVHCPDNNDILKNYNSFSDDGLLRNNNFNEPVFKEPTAEEESRRHAGERQRRVVESANKAWDKIGEVLRYGQQNVPEGTDMSGVSADAIVETGKKATQRLIEAYFKAEEGAAFTKQKLNEIVDKVIAALHKVYGDDMKGINEQHIRDTLREGIETQAEPFITGTKNAITEKELDDLGLDPIDKQNIKHNQATVDRLKAEIDAKKLDPMKVAADIIFGDEGDKLSNDEKEWALMIHKVALKAKMNDIQDSLSDSYTKSDIAATERLADQKQKVIDDFYFVSQAAKELGTRWGQQGQARSREMREDYSLVAQLSRARENNFGEPISEEQQKRIEDLVAERDNLVAQKKDVDEQNAKLRSELEVQRQINEVLKKRKTREVRTRPSLSASEAAEKQALRKKYAGVLNDVTRIITLLAEKDFRRYASLVLKEAAGDFASFAKEMIENVGEGIKEHLPKLYSDLLGIQAEQAIPDNVKAGEAIAHAITNDATLGDMQPMLRKRLRELVVGGMEDHNAITKVITAELEAEYSRQDKPIDFTERDVRDAISGYGKTKAPNPEEIAKQIRDINEKLRLTSAKEDVLIGKAPLRSGYQADEKSDEVRQMRQEVKRIMKESGIQDRTPEQRWKSALEAVKTGLRNRITDLNKIILDYQSTGTLAATPTKERIALDEDAQQLKLIANKLKERLAEIEKETGVDNEKKVKRSLSVVNDGIAKLQTLIANRDFSDKQKSQSVSSPELEAARKQKQDLMEQFKLLRNQADPYYEDRKALEKWRTAAQTRLEKAQEKLNQLRAGTFTPPAPRKTLPFNSEDNRLQGQIKQLQRDIDKEQDAIRLANRTKFEKVVDGIINYRTSVNLLSGLYTLGKLGSFSATEILAKQPLDLVGIALSKAILPKTAKLSRVEGHFGGQMEFYKTLFKSQTYKDAWELKTRSQALIDLLFDDYIKSEKFVISGGKVHAIEKYPLKKATFEKYFIKYGDAMQREDPSFDMTNEANQKIVGALALEQANRAILQSKNVLTTTYRNTMASLERQGIYGKIGYYTIKTLFPIVNVPVNFTVKTVRAYAGVLEAATRLAFYSHDMTPTQADAVIRAFKAGLPGLGLGIIALATSAISTDDKKNLYIGGWKVPAFMTHHPDIFIMKLYAEAKADANSTYKSGENAGEQKGSWHGIEGMGLETLHEIPFLNDRVYDALTTPEKLNQLVENLAVSFVEPQGLKDIAKMKDTPGNFPSWAWWHNEPNKRTPHGFVQELMTGIPGLREKVPMAPVETPAQMQKHKLKEMRSGSDLRKIQKKQLKKQGII